MTKNASKEGKAAAMGGGTRWTRRVVLGVVCALVIGVYAWSANSGLIEFLGSNAENTYYNLLVQGFRAGQLNLETKVPPGLAQLKDPYDPVANSSYRWNYGHPLHDLSYYKGKLYLYFGITPALVLFWPYAALTGHYLLHKDAAVIFFSVGFLAGAGLLLALWRRYFAGVSFWIIIPCLMALGLANFTPAILRRCDVYEVAISCGYALTMLALAGIWNALHQPRRRGRWLAAASLAYGLAVAARPSLLFGAIILLAPVALALREKQREWPLFLMAATVPVVLIGLGLMFYNALRFDNPLEFGQHYQLSAFWQETMQQFSLRYLWFNLRIVFLEPAHWSGHFPFVNDIVMPSLPKGAEEAEHPFGVLTNIPLVGLALAVPLLWRRGPAEDRSTLRWFLWAVALVFGMSAFTIGLHNVMCLRYEVEFTHPLVLLAVIGILGVEQALAGQPAWRRAVRCGWGFLLTFSVAFNLFASYGLQADAHRKLGNAFVNMGRIDEAIKQYQEALAINPGYAAAHVNLGNAFLQKGEVDDAISHYERALQIKPGEAEMHYNLGNAFLQKGSVDDAITQYQEALAIKPGYADAEVNLGNAFLQKGSVDDAISHYERALQIRPDFAQARHNLGLALSRKGRADDAIIQFQQALQFSPDYVDAHVDLGNVLLQKGRVEEAMAHFQQALQIAPADPWLRNNLAWFLATSAEASLRNGNKAVELAERANQLTSGKNPIILRTLAAALAEAGRFPEAVETAQRALHLAGAQSNTNLAGRLQIEMQLYQAGSPFHLPQQKH